MIPKDDPAARCERRFKGDSSGHQLKDYELLSWALYRLYNPNWLGDRPNDSIETMVRYIAEIRAR